MYSTPPSHELKYHTLTGGLFKDSAKISVLRRVFGQKKDEMVGG
jgi:hypothetical protein